MHVKNTQYIVNKTQDSIFVLFLPIILLVFFVSINHSLTMNEMFAPLVSLIIYFDFSHLLLVFWRSHGNQQIFTKFKKRMLLSPLLIVALVILPSHLLFYFACLVALWDLWHISMQNFGLARIYEVKTSKDTQKNRLSDQLIHLSIFLIPAFVLTRFTISLDLDQLFASNAPWGELNYIQELSLGSPQFIALSLIFSVIILIVLKKSLFTKDNSINKLIFTLTLSISLFMAFVFLPIEQAITMVALLHGLQYYWIVWHKEKGHLFSKLPLIASLFIFLAVTLLCTYLIYLIVEEWFEVGVAIIVAIRILHFWYDGFIWSIRSNDLKAN
ncbi:MAG: hypothetical protein CME71_05240 [Halobacteriovorax sp.]|nr:hypothetical protein [Halobacteriovorax sp.]|tara:strand:+ start:639 stop:1622 length:984 start_codon:yes stop_codon:yes gene_type:complete